MVVLGRASDFVDRRVAGGFGVAAALRSSGGGLDAGELPTDLLTANVTTLYIPRERSPRLVLGWCATPKTIPSGGIEVRSGHPQA
jgi:hypothetical protein